MTERWRERGEVWEVVKEGRVCRTHILSLFLCLVARVRGEQVQEEDITPAKSVGLMNFLVDITRGLLRARRILATSYGIGYLIPDERKAEREAHETLQVTPAPPTAPHCSPLLAGQA